MSLQVVGLGSECASGASADELMSQGQLQGALLWSYLGAGAEGVPESTLHPPFMEYTARVFDDVSVLVRDCPDWELLDSEWSSVRKAVEKADVLVMKYSVSDKQAFQWLRTVLGPRLRPLIRHCGVPVILVAVGARLNDWRHCVPHVEGLGLSRELGATYLELPSLNHVFVGRYFGSVLEYFMIQCLKHKAKDRPEKRKGNKLHDLRPPHLEQPARLPPIRVEESTFCQDLQWLLERGVQFADVAFFSSDSGQELGWGHAAVLCAASPYFRSLLLGPKTRERPQSRCVCRERDPGPHSLISCEAAIVEDLPPRQTDALLSSHLTARLSRLVVKDPLLCLCLWETLMFIYRGAWEWDHLQEALEEKLKNPLAVVQLLERIRSLLGRDRAQRDTPSARVAQLGPQTLVNLFNSPLYSDVIFMVQGSVLPAHRAVLVARCDVMAAMFSGKYAEARSRVVPIHGVSSDTFLSFLEYLYTDSCCPGQELHPTTETLTSQTKLMFPS
ncbi:rho-related BTB domain-containing protein 3-like [Eucyclogobius newberryi]|uniref:rho-related BTB domain-containing protein 3-like n=1 Tax=Eucyclogobius newberryi TaxID=166745 RepID=UPI003B5C2701